jgi:hypothetical protein
VHQKALALIRSTTAQEWATVINWDPQNMDEVRDCDMTHQISRESPEYFVVDDCDMLAADEPHQTANPQTSRQLA